MHVPSKVTSKNRRRRFHLARIRLVDAAEPKNITDQKGEACESRGALLRPHKRRMKRLEGEHAHKRGAVPRDSLGEQDEEATLR